MFFLMISTAKPLWDHLASLSKHFTLFSASPNCVLVVLNSLVTEFVFYRYQRVSPDCLPLSNGKKPNIENGKIIQTNGNSNTSNLEAKAFRFRSPAKNQDHHSLSQFGGATDNSHLHHPHHENTSNTQQTQRQENSPSPSPSPSHGGSGDVLLQWGHKKRARVSRAEIRALTDESSSSAQARQAVKLLRRAVHSSSSEKLPTNTTMPPPPPPAPSSAATSSSSNGRARKESSGLLPSRYPPKLSILSCVFYFLVVLSWKTSSPKM